VFFGITKLKINVLKCLFVFSGVQNFLRRHFLLQTAVFFPNLPLSKEVDAFDKKNLRRMTGAGFF